jgi:cytochrome c-type biogenesis protein
VPVESVSLLVAFGAGLLSFLSPCVLPLVPSYVTFVTGLSLDDAERRLSAPSVRRTAAIHSLLFVAGFSAVFVALGASATGLGQVLREHQSLIRKAGGVFVILLGLHLLGRPATWGRSWWAWPSGPGGRRASGRSSAPS